MAGATFRRIHAGSESQHRFFLRWARPAAALTALAAFGAVELAEPSREVERLLIVLGIALAFSPLYLLAARRVPLAPLVGVALAVDTLLIAAMEAVLQNPHVPAVGYFWAIALSAFLCGSRETIALTALSVACALSIPPLFGIEVDGIALVTNVLVLCLIGGLLAHMSATARRTQQSLARDRAHDAAVLRLAERIRTPLDIGELLEVTVEELGKACKADRCILRLASREGRWPPAYEWQVGGLEPIGHAEPPAGVKHVFATGEPLIVDDLDDETAASLHPLEAPASVIAIPVRWQDKVIAVLGFQDAAARDWRREGLPLLERVVPQVAAALAQAELFEQQQTALERIEELIRLREQLVANVSHELRTPLTATLGFLQTLERPDLDLDAGERRRLLSIARAEAERLAALVEDLLELARVERGSMRLERVPVEIRPLLEHAAARLPLPPGRRIEIHVDSQVAALGDSHRLLQVFSNLLANGIGHGRGTVRVTAEPSERRIALAFSDDGPGVPLDRRAQLFVPFASWGEHHDSTGLGLAIAHGLVQAHGGSLVYRPAENGRPHAFVVELARPAGATYRGTS